MSCGVLRLPSQGSRGRRPRAPQLLQEALCTAPATQKAAAAPPGGSVYCACHAKGSRGPSGAHARRSSSRRLCVLRLPRQRQPRPKRRPRAPLLQEALCTAPATQKAAAAPGGSVYCACHAKSSRGPSGAHARRSSSRRLCVLRLPRQTAPTRAQEALCTAPATRKAAAAPAAPTRAAAPPGGSVYCVCHAKRRPRAPRRLCVLRLPRERQPRPQRRPRAPQLLQEALCTAPATPKAARKLSVQ